MPRFYLVVVGIVGADVLALAFYLRAVAEDMRGRKRIEHSLVAVAPHVAASAAGADSCAVHGNHAVPRPAIERQGIVLAVNPRHVWDDLYAAKLPPGCQSLVAVDVPLPVGQRQLTMN